MLHYIYLPLVLKFYNGHSCELGLVRLWRHDCCVPAIGETLWCPFEPMDACVDHDYTGAWRSVSEIRIREVPDRKPGEKPRLGRTEPIVEIKLEPVEMSTNQAWQDIAIEMRAAGWGVVGQDIIQWPIWTVPPALPTDLDLSPPAP